MNLFRHKKYRTVFKGTFIVLYLALFGSQLSHKFYLFANFSSGQFKEYNFRLARKQTFLQRDSPLLDHQGRARLHLNKRYAFKQIFAIFSPEVTLKPVYANCKKEFTAFYETFSLSYFAVHPLRGPPSV